MVDGHKKFDVVSHSIVESLGVFSRRNFLYFSTPRTAIPAFFKHIFGYTAFHYAVDRLNLQ